MKALRCKDHQQDEIARRAAALIHTGRAGMVREAIDRAVDRLGYHDVPRPSTGLVRKHARGIAMQELGDVGYDEAIRDVWRIAEDLMTALALAMPDDASMLVGRAAQGQIDAGVTLNIRLYTDQKIGVVASAIVELGYDDPVIETVNTRFGRANRLRFVEAGHDVVLTRCLKKWKRDAGVDLFNSRPIETLTLHDLRERIGDEDLAGVDPDLD